MTVNGKLKIFAILAFVGVVLMATSFVSRGWSILVYMYVKYLDKVDLNWHMRVKISK